VSFFFHGLAINVHGLVRIANLLYGEFDAANFENIALLNLIVDFLVVYLQTTHYQVHGLLLLAVRLDVGEVIRMVLKGSALQVERAVVMVYYFQHRHVLRRPLRSLELFLEA